MAEWARIVNTTIRQYVREEEVNVLRNRKLTALAKARNRISFNNSGESLDWKVRYKRAPLVGMADADTMTFARRNRWKTAVLPIRGYAATDSMTKRERLANRSTEAVIKIYSNIARLLMEDIEESFGDEWYIDGNAAGNQKRLHGFESFFAATQTIDYSTGAPRSANAGDRVGAPNDTYAGLSTALGAYGGSWTGSWPQGSGDSHYDFWSPVIVNYTSSTFSGSTKVWAAQGDEAMRYMIIQCQRNKSKRGALDLILLNATMYEGFLNLIEGKERFVSRPGRNEGSLAKLGFTDSVNWDGCDVSWEYTVPAGVGYGINFDALELRSWQPTLFVAEGPTFSHSSNSYRFSIDFYGNLQCNPRNFGKLLTLA